MCIYMYMCIHTCTHTHEVLFSPWEGRSSVASWVRRRENPSSVPRAPLQRCRNCCWGASQWPSVSRKRQCGQLHPAPITGLSRSALRRAGVFPLDNTVWAPWAVVAVVACLLGEESQMNLVEKHFSCCLLPAQHGSPSGGKRPLPSAEGWALPLPCPFPWSKWKDSFDISVFDFSAWNESSKDWYRTVRLLTELQAVSELWGRDRWGLCALGRGSKQQRAQRLWKEQPWPRSEIQMGHLGLEGSSCLSYEVKILSRSAQTT